MNINKYTNKIFEQLDRRKRAAPSLDALVVYSEREHNLGWDKSQVSDPKL